jgi:predicted aldo/keto reductase-like oxidoreductase
MLYRRFGKTNIMLSALGIGTTRFQTETDEDIENSVEIVRKAINMGINYIDLASRYSKGKAEKIIKMALTGIKNNIHLTVKAGNGIDKTSDDTYRRICSSLENLQINKATFFVLWSIKSYSELLEVLKPGNLYDGVLKAKAEGLIDHICVSLHSPVDDTIKIMKSGIFDGITISYSVINQASMQPVLNHAEELNLGVISMNTLGGGLIPQNPDFFEFLKTDKETITQSALTYVYAHPQITTMLSGMRTLSELNENCKSVLYKGNINKSKTRIHAVNEKIKEIIGFCTGCRYCDDCPQNINIPEMMQSYNTLLFKSDTDKFFYRRKNKRLLENIGICKKLNQAFSYIPTDTNNPCINCDNCEKKCTQSIHIVKRISELYARFRESSYSEQDIQKRIISLLPSRYKKIALYPSSQYIGVFLDYLYKALPDAKFDFFLFDKNKTLWGTYNNGIVVKNPAELLKILPDIVIVVNYIYEDEIFNSLSYLRTEGLNVVKLHKPDDVPWFF